MSFRPRAFLPRQKRAAAAGPPLALARAKDALGGGEPRRAAAVPLADGRGFGRRLKFALREQGALGDHEVEAEFVELFVDRRGEIARNGEAGLAQFLRDEI